MHLANWFYDNVIGNTIANLIVLVPTWIVAVWRLEKRHRKHMDAIHNQISQELANVTGKSNA